MMKWKYLLLLVAVATCFTALAQARSKVKKSKKQNFKLIEGYTQRIVPGIKDAPKTTEEHIAIIWQNKTYPETFFWRGKTSWQPCKIEKAHRLLAANNRFKPQGLDYSTESVMNDAIHKGDTLLLTPIIGGKFRLPNDSDFTDTTQNKIFYKVNGNNKWQSYIITDMKHKPDVIMP